MWVTNFTKQILIAITSTLPPVEREPLSLCEPASARASLVTLLPLVKIHIETKGVSGDKGVHLVINVATIVYRACSTSDAFVYEKLLTVTWENRALITPHFVNYGPRVSTWKFIVHATWIVQF